MGAGEANVSSFFLKAGMDAALARSFWGKQELFCYSG